jgi:hypothetical protein
MTTTLFMAVVKQSVRKQIYMPHNFVTKEPTLTVIRSTEFTAEQLPSVSSAEGKPRRKKPYR